MRLHSGLLLFVFTFRAHGAVSMLHHSWEEELLTKHRVRTDLSDLMHATVFMLNIWAKPDTMVFWWLFPGQQSNENEWPTLFVILVLYCQHMEVERQIMSGNMRHTSQCLTPPPYSCHMGWPHILKKSQALCYGQVHQPGKYMQLGHGGPCEPNIEQQSMSILNEKKPLSGKRWGKCPSE